MSRRLVINADDLGLSSEINSGILCGLKNNLISDTSVMVKAPYAEPAVSALKALGIRHAGVHINLDDNLGWKPGGIEIKTRHVLMGLLNNHEFLKKCAQEIREQIEIFLSFGLIPTHIDTHHHVHGFSSIFEILVDLIMEYQIPALRFSRYGYMLPTREDIPFDDKSYAHMQEAIESRKLYFCVHYMEGAQKIDAIDPGTTELVVHPSLGGESWREEELEILKGKSGYERLEPKGILLVSFLDMLHR